MISNRILELFCNMDNLKKAIPPYKNAIKQSGYKDNLIFSETQSKKKSRKCKIIWFNPPFNKYVVNDIRKDFLKLINKHFPPQHKLYKILNRNSIKISPSTSLFFSVTIFPSASCLIVVIVKAASRFDVWSLISSLGIS